MALITDTDFLIHNLRLSYLREVQDPYGPRLISLDPSYASNPYIVAASLADSDRWPELAMPSSPQISEDETERPSGFLGARLKYTQTIMGDRPGGFGIRVNGKRTFTSKRMSSIVKQQTPLGERPVALSNTAPVANGLTSATSDIREGYGKEKGETMAVTSSSQPNVQVQAPTVVEEAPVTKAVQFVPRFARAAEMEARRRARIAARRMPGFAPQPPPPTPAADFTSSEEDVNVLDDSSDDFGVSDQVASIDETDDFDPEFAAMRTAITYDSASDVVSDISTSMSNASGPISPSHANGRSRSRLSPVDEGSAPRNRRISEESIDNNFMVTQVPPEPPKEKYYPPRRLDTGIHTQPTTRSKPVNVIHAPQLATSAPNLTFTRKKVGPIRPVKSTLASIMASSGSTNPFSELYAAVSGRGEMASVNVKVFFPHATEPSGTPVSLNVKKDATVEEVIGFALWTYWEEQWLPKLGEGMSREGDPKWEEGLSTVRWVLRIAEIDGEVDDDFPPPDRMGKISRFNSEAYAIIEATPTQVEQNKIIHEKMHKRADKLIIPGPNAPPTATSATTISTIDSMVASSYLGPSTIHGPQILLKIRIAEHADAVHVSTTIPVSAGMYLQEALELVCRKRRQMDPKDYALLLGDQSLLIPLDRTVASLQGKTELLLVKRSMLPQYGEDIVRGIGKTTDPNASIFKRMSDTPDAQFGSTDYTAAYKKYAIHRKMPMLVAKQERTLAIDGVYIHIMPSNRAKAVFDNAKTSSYHINSIAQCKQSTKMTSIFKLVLNGRGSGNKRYDFEAETPRHAAEIVSTINSLRSALERSGTVNRSRRSKHIG
ncbi:hypothetical protein AX15_003038 [Amanita polypyramis BW_CC]|nr:hypothetical protein AX15_003038 [Amanita polypyramis BW_CC]